MKPLLKEISNCIICEKHLPLGCKPVIRASPLSKIAIIGQAPGRKVHESGIPWNDKSGERLRDWLGVSKEAFYDPDIFALIPMGFCYPGTGKTGDLPPRPECASEWHDKLWSEMKDIKLTLLFGLHAQKYYLDKKIKPTLTQTVKAHKEYLPNFLPMPHPSPRNNIWMKKNEWFAQDVLPELKRAVFSIL